MHRIYFLLRWSNIVLFVFLYGNVVHAKPHRLVQKVIKLLEVESYQKKKKKENKKDKEVAKSSTEDAKKMLKEEEKTVGEESKEDAEISTTLQQAKTLEEEKTVGEESKEDAEISTTLQQAKTLMDQAIEDPVAKKKASTWYYRGLIYEKLIQKNITDSVIEPFLKEVLESYHKVAVLVDTTRSPYYHAAQMNLDNLWNYFCDRSRRYYRQGFFEYAWNQLEICEYIKPQDPLTALYMGIVAHHNNDFIKALEKYETYLSLQGNEPAVYIGIAAIYQHLQEDEKALAILEKAVAKHPFDNDLLEEQLKIYTKLDYRIAKEKILTEQAYNNPFDPVLCYTLGYWYEDANQLDLAITYYKKAIQSVPDEPVPISQLGLLYYNQAIGFYKAIKILENEYSSKERWQCRFPYGIIELDFSKLLLNKLFTSIVSYPILQKVDSMLLFPMQQWSCIYTYPIRSRVSNNFYNFSMLYTDSLGSIRRCYNQKLLNYIADKAYFKYKKSFKIALKQALEPLQKAYKLNPKNPLIAQCLYNTYYYLKKRASARALLQAMHQRKHFLNEKQDFFNIMK